MGLIFIILLIIFIVLKKTGKLKWGWWKTIGIPFLITLALTMVSHIAKGSNATSAETNSQTTQQSAQATSSANQQSPSVPDMTVDAISLYNEYKSNEVAADNKYKGHLLAITGQIADIHKIDENTVDVEVGIDEFGMGDVICEMSTQNSALNSISKGQNTTLIGEVNGDGLTLERVKLKEGCYVATK